MDIFIFKMNNQQYKQRYCVKCGFAVSSTHEGDGCQRAFEQQRQSLRNTQSELHQEQALKDDLMARQDKSQREKSVLEAKISQMDQEIYDLEKENQQLMNDYDEIFGRGSALK